MLIDHNTISGTATYGIDLDTFAGTGTGTIDGVSITNNILSGDASGADPRLRPAN